MIVPAVNARPNIKLRAENFKTSIMNETAFEPDLTCWRKYVADWEFQAKINDDREAAEVFDSFLFYWLKLSTVSKVTLYVVPSFKDDEFLITPDAEFYVSSLLGVIIKEIVTKAKNLNPPQSPPTDFITSNN